MDRIIPSFEGQGSTACLPSTWDPGKKLYDTYCFLSELFVRIFIYFLYENKNTIVLYIMIYIFGYSQYVLMLSLSTNAIGILQLDF